MSFDSESKIWQNWVPIAMRSQPKKEINCYNNSAYSPQQRGGNRQSFRGCTNRFLLFHSCYCDTVTHHQIDTTIPTDDHVASDGGLDRFLVMSAFPSRKTIEITFSQPCETRWMKEKNFFKDYKSGSLNFDDSFVQLKFVNST